MSSGVVSAETKKKEQQQLMKSTPSSEFHVEMFHLGSSTAGLRRFLKERIPCAQTPVLDVGGTCLGQTQS